MKKTIRIVLPLLLVAALGGLVYRMVHTAAEKKNKSEEIARMPALTLQTTDGAHFDNTNLHAGQEVLFIYFNTECDFCHIEAREVASKLPILQQTQVLFVSTEPVEAIVDFQKKYGLDTSTNVLFLRDSGMVFASSFGLSSPPSFVMYNREGQLVYAKSGAVKLDYILKQARRHDGV